MQNNPGVQAFMKDHNMSDVKQLEQHYILRLLNLTKRTGSPNVLTTTSTVKTVALNCG